MCGQRETSHSVGRNGNESSHNQSQYRDFSKKEKKQTNTKTKTLKVDLSHDPPILLLGIHSKGSKSTYHSDTYTSMFVAELFTILNCRSNVGV